jgi:hypothetical protein
MRIDNLKLTLLHFLLVSLRGWFSTVRGFED